MDGETPVRKDERQVRVLPDIGGIGPPVGDGHMHGCPDRGKRAPVAVCMGVKKSGDSAHLASVCLCLRAFDTLFPER
jgi:hypothetical protein